MREVIAATEQYVQRALDGDSAHDWYHTSRVRQWGLRIGRAEGADLSVVELGALLHDVDDWKFSGDDEASARSARQWLESQRVAPEVVAHVSDIVRNVSFKGAHEENGITTIEGMCVQDADRLESIGAIAIARTFAYGGWNGRAIYDPEHPPKPDMSAAEYRAQQGTSINHFYEKLLLLKDRLNTQTARDIAESRHQFQLDFLEQFFAEWNGER